ncbi:MAG: hypothetical protein Q8P54_01180 [bacterium]|nr:hypothetical protein [bacterium]
MEEEKTKAPKSDNSNDKIMGVISYIGILWIVPMLAAKDSKFAMYHANQGLVLFLLGVLVGFVGGLIPFVGWFLVAPIGSVFVLILAIMGIINALNGQMKPLPLIGGFKILK